MTAPREPAQRPLRERYAPDDTCFDYGQQNDDGLGPRGPAPEHSWL